MVSSVWCNTLILLILTVLLFVIWMKRKLTFWDRRGIKTPEPVFFFGNVKELFTPRVQISYLFRRHYEYLKKLRVHHGGFYFMHLPFYIPVDPKLIKHIFEIDFPHFIDRGLYYNEHSDPMGAHLVALEGTKWRNLRASLTPAFTSGRMKVMFDEMLNLSQLLLEQISVKPQNTLDVLNATRRLTIDIICSCAFGINCKLVNGRTDFLRKTDAIFESITSVFFLVIFPNLMKMLGGRQLKKSFCGFFTEMIKEVMEHRERNNIQRDDFLGLLIQLMNKNNNNERKFKKKSEAITFNELTAQAFIFYFGGFETSSVTLSFCLFELASSEQIQEKLRQEIIETYENNGNEFTYDVVMKMTYIEQVIFETLRKYPPFPSILRKCTKDYTVPGTNLTLERGTRVTIPVIGLHYDEEYYPNPHVFDPDRFSKENKSKIPEFTFLPFGGGPRTCIGQRFAMMLVKVALCVILRKTKLTVSSKTKLPIEFDNLHFSLSPKNEIWLNCSQIDS